MPTQNIIETTESLLKKREKRKWQIALRRYITEKSQGSAYARYFGLDIENIREWISIQFGEGLSWENFAKSWQFDHIVPVAYFDFSKEEDLLLCWNFINIRVERVDLNKARGNRIDVMGVRSYFEDLYNKTQYPFCLKMLEKIKTIEVSNIESNNELVAFIVKNKAYFEQVAQLDQADFQRLNEGASLKTVLAEKELVRKFGG
ncbi:MAG: hypothetical protein IPL50_12770 [Chitinophagaceae bacterium]|nr:hypothetical protein [Chitinophagaceae bacterium]